MFFSTVSLVPLSSLPCSPFVAHTPSPTTWLTLPLFLLLVPPSLCGDSGGWWRSTEQLVYGGSMSGV
ncbi:unnamed protein product [Sphenostylis stenocarpa]|uniref:Secreted protein n=1 Tax=Sphenostylis stenocarpa TaxID=92480 RepID=A0AA86RZ08_9FABA|nr:unnamed protein product [Sphenostylis stenocarpa]